MEAMKGKKSVASPASWSARPAPARRRSGRSCSPATPGMGSSAMGASVLRKKIQSAGHGEVTVVNKAISNLTDTYDLVVTHQDLTERARQKTPSAIHVSVDNFMGSPRYDEIVELIDQSSAGHGGHPWPRPTQVRRSTSSWRARSSWVAGPRTVTPRSTRPATCWCRPARSTRRTSPPCTTGSSRSRRSWATGWRSRTAPMRPRARSGGRRSRSCATTCPWTGTASRPSS